LFYQFDSEYHSDYISASSININIIEKVFKMTRTSISVSMIVSLSQEQIQIIYDAVQTAVTAVLKRFNLQIKSSDSSELSEPKEQ